ncbi:hypothetical protein MOO46_07480 (plasmid) [Apilactobacillus apisilvae]|uniref:RNA polymerase sigma factor 70 region 4 type 2 domain-containing protein n=1 Tax=Apilactobacillus apisilvae TaxID=2923364 RepID=A0ABY4PKI8_9LACO|nr:hypothetical protein [Apilactobacillus apisilvae]UQS85767.1 hypothetical protein MOO46_07480 [Apilactobacillus apisilvae]
MKTIDEVFEKYDKCNRTKVKNQLLSGIDYSQEKVVSSSGNVSEDKLNNHIDSTKYCEKVDAAIKLLDTEEYSIIIQMIYIEHKTNLDVANFIGVSEKTVRRHKKDAIKNFLEICPYIDRKLTA